MRSEVSEPTVFLVDDDPAVLRATERLIRSAGYKAAAFSTAAEFLEQLNAKTPGCLVLDVKMPAVNGMDLQHFLFEAGNRLPIIFLSGTDDVPTGVTAMKTGAFDFLCKPCPDSVLLETIRRALELDARSRQQASARAAVVALFAELTPREHEVMLGVIAGKPNKRIAHELGTVEQTIKVHRARVMEKLCVSTLADLIRLTERAKIEN